MRGTFNTTTTIIKTPRPNPTFVINGQSANDKKIIRDRKKEKQAENKKEKQAEKKKKECEKIIVPTAECGVSRKDPVGNTHPTLPPTKTTDGTGTKGPSPGAATATITNGKTTSAIANGKGLTVTATSSGTITVSSTDHSSVAAPQPFKPAPVWLFTVFPMETFS